MCFSYKGRLIKTNSQKFIGLWLTLPWKQTKKCTIVFFALPMCMMILISN